MRQRLRRLPSVVLLVVAFALFVVGGVLATLPYDVPAADDPATTVECGPPLFEMVVPSDDGNVPVRDGCRSAAAGRFGWGLVLMAVGLGAGFAARRLHRQQVMAAHEAAAAGSSA